MLEWTPHLATGNATVDAQNRALLGCLGDLKRAMREGRTLFAVYTLTRLKHHVRDHFEADEALLRASHAPDLNEHLVEHQAFRTQLAEFQMKSIHGDVSMDMVDYLINWLEQHVKRAVAGYKAVPAAKG